MWNRDNIRQLTQDYEKQIEVATAGLERVRKYCPHPDAEKVAKSDTGNWDKADDKYWYDCKCWDCGKKWQEDQ